MTEDSHFVGLQGESDCSFLEEPKLPSVREPYPPLSVNPYLPFER